MSIKKTIAKEITQLKKNYNKYQAQKYKTIVAGIQNYYCKAPMVSKELGEMGYILGIKLIKLFGKGSYAKDKYYCRRYRNYNFRVWNVAEVTLYTIGICKYKIVKSCSSKKEMFDKIEEELNETSDLKAIEWEKVKAKWISSWEWDASKTIKNTF